METNTLLIHSPLRQFVPCHGTGSSNVVIVGPHMVVDCFILDYLHYHPIAPEDLDDPFPESSGIE